MILRFVLSFALLFPSLLWLSRADGTIPWLGVLLDALTNIQVWTAAAFLRLFEPNVVSSGPTLLGNAGYSCDVATGCNGIDAILLVFAGLLAFPLPWRQRTVGLLLLVPSVILINVLRIIGLFLTGALAPRAFVFAHVYVGQVVVIGVTVALWLTWIDKCYKSEPAQSGAHS